MRGLKERHWQCKHIVAVRRSISQSSNSKIKTK
ncbi:MAG: hypothetical protein F4Z46_03935 [Cenarchaeum sp. SB0667_bin_13]|nr:hypothetical protein [Cenarchaeum sp. SB0667_bin_13]